MNYKKNNDKKDRLKTFFPENYLVKTYRSINAFN